MTKSNSNKKEIAVNYVMGAFRRYPDWGDSLILPKPIYPVKLQKVDISKKQMAQVPIDEIPKSVLCGTILGDTSFSIDGKYVNARFQARHSTRQAAWFTWKYFVILKEFTNLTGVIYQSPDGFQTKSPLAENETNLGKLKIASKVHPKLTELHRVICVNNRKTIQRSWLNHMNNYFLMTLWLDDGSLTRCGSQGQLSLQSTPLEEQLILREYLLNVWGIETTEVDLKQTMKNGQPAKAISINKIDSLLTLFRLIAPIIPVSDMLEKVCFVPRGNESLLQRWRTELLDLVKPEFRPRIEQIYDEINVQRATIDESEAL